MTLQELKDEICKYQYFEDTRIIDIALASIIATRLSLGDPIWLIVIGASSGGKSQILRPLAMTDEKYMHRVDDLTENTFLSASKKTKGQEEEKSLLLRIGSRGIIVISDLTVLFSKAKEQRATILSQFRMIYDGEMTKFSGNSEFPLTWKGSLGVISGSTPSIYSHFEEVADMGERFIYYRMKDFDSEKATRLAMKRTIYGKELDRLLAEKYKEYIKYKITNYIGDKIELGDEVKERILRIALFSEKVRTTVHVDWDKNIDRIPVPAMPMRVALQLTSVAKGLFVLRDGKLGEEDMTIIDWCGYSLANEEKRACLKTLASIPSNTYLTTQKVADIIGLSTRVTSNILQNLASIGVIERNGTQDSLMWKFAKENEWKLVRSIEGIEDDIVHEDRELASEEMDKTMSDDMFNSALKDFEDTKNGTV